MSSVDKARETQVKNIEEKTGKSLHELAAIIAASPLKKHGELRTMVKEQFGLGHGDANTLVHVVRQMTAGDEEEKPMHQIVSAIYTGKKEALIPLHESIMQQLNDLGPFEIAPKKTYLSLRRKKQFAMVGPASKGRVEIGLNMKGVEGTSRLEALPPGKMCQYRVYLTDKAEIDEELLGWITTAYESAG